MLQIMRPYQLATVMVMAHPWVPDTGPVLDLVAQAEGEPPAQALMGIDKVPGTRGIGSWTLEWTGTFASSLTTEPDGEVPLFIHAFFRSLFVHSLIDLFTHSFNPFIIHSSVCSVPHPFMHAFICSFILSFVHSFIHSFRYCLSG